MQAGRLSTKIAALLLAAGLGVGLALFGSTPAGAAETTSGKPGESFDITLSGAKAKSRITAELAGSTAKATADGAGRARLTIKVPDVEAGEYTLHITGGLTEDVRFRVVRGDGPAKAATTAPPAGGAAQAASPATAPAGATGPARATPKGIKDPASLLAGVGLVAGGIAALALINARARARRRRFVPVGFG